MIDTAQSDDRRSSLDDVRGGVRLLNASETEILKSVHKKSARMRDAERRKINYMIIRRVLCAVARPNLWYWVRTEFVSKHLSGLESRNNFQNALVANYSPRTTVQYNTVYCRLVRRLFTWKNIHRRWPSFGSPDDFHWYPTAAHEPDQVVRLPIGWLPHATTSIQFVVIIQKPFFLSEKPRYSRVTSRLERNHSRHGIREVMSGSRDLARIERSGSTAERDVDAAVRGCEEGDAIALTMYTIVHIVKAITSF
ncbi:hypothetical protein EVAR_51552_1 [Eumeta japonica]|uniref:Uncharacterized protein n=1 Tax=Eumeta variegata TaxID=151549 RepID=A0A4C1YEA8_EUMVA|nr:hypothetical protein EVAR_51552_1 [Eumeta japonica]